MVSRSLGTWDLILEGEGMRLGFNLAQESGRPAVEPFELGSGREGDPVRHGDLVRTIDNLDAGMGFSRRVEQIPNGYAYTLPGYCRAPGGIFMPAGKLTEIALPSLIPTSPTNPNRVMTSALFNGRIYLILAGREILQISTDGNSAPVNATYPAPWNGAGAAVFNNRLYVSGMNGGLAYLDMAGVWQPAVNVQRKDLAVVNWRPLGVPTDVMLGISLPNFTTIRWCPITADPMVDASWSAPIQVGPRQTGAGPIVAMPRHAYINAADGIYDMDELGVRAFNIAPWIAEGIDPANGQWGLPLGDGVYYSHSQGLAFVRTNGETQYRPEWAHPAWGLPYEGPVRGAATAGTLHNGWGLTSLSPAPYAGNATSYLMAGRRAGDGAQAYGGATHIWHGAEAILSDSVTHMRVYTLPVDNYQPRLLICTTDWMASTGGAGPARVRCFWQSLPKFGTPLQSLLWGGGFVPADAASLFLPADAHERPSALKTLLQLDLLTERLNLGSDVLKAYAAGDDGLYAEMGTAEEGTYTSLRPLNAAEGRAVAARVDATGSPLLRSLELRSAMGVELREARTYNVILAWDNALKGAVRGRETKDPEQRLADLQQLLGKICQLSDAVSSAPRRCRVLQVQAGERRRLGGASRAGSNGTEGAWAVTAAITVSLLDRPYRWDGPASTDRWDRDRVYL